MTWPSVVHWQQFPAFVSAIGKILPTQGLGGLCWVPGEVLPFFQAALPGLNTTFCPVSHLIKTWLLDAAGAACGASSQYLYVPVLLLPKWKCAIALKRVSFCLCFCFKVFEQFTDRLFFVSLIRFYLLLYIYFKEGIVTKSSKDSLCCFPRSIILSLQFFFKGWIIHHSMHWNCTLLIETLPGAALKWCSKPAHSTEQSVSWALGVP